MTPTYITQELPLITILGLWQGGGSGPGGSLTRDEAMARHHERLRRRGLLAEDR